MVRDTLLDFFRDLANAGGEFLIHDDGFRTRSFSYTDVGAAARGFAARLQAAGLRKGDTVVFFSENRPEWIVAFWGCLLTGVVVVPVDYRSSPAFVDKVRRIVNARIVLIGQDVPDLAEAPSLITRAGAPPPALSNADASLPLGMAAGAPSNSEIWRLHELDWADGQFTAVPISKDDIAEIIFTSGATAEPKGVVITHRNVLANVVPVEREVHKYRKWGRPFFPLRFLNLLPLSHMFGQAMATFVPPMLPGVVVFMRGYNPGEIVDQIRRRRVSVLVSVPKILEVLREHILRVAPETATISPIPKALDGKFGRVAVRWWRYRRVHRMFGWKFWACVVGAAPLDAALETAWGDLGYLVIQGYGLTETAPIVSLNHPFGTKKGSVGKAIAGVEIKIAEDGEILVRGENVTTGYFGAAEETARAFEDGWFHTGDIGEVSADGQIFIRGRKKEMIVTPEGLNVFPEDVELVLNRIPGVHESAVVGIATQGSQERVHAVVVADAGADLDAIVRQANASLADHQKIRRAMRWPDAHLPRTDGTSKLKRAAIRDWASTGHALPAAITRGDTLSAIVARYAGNRDMSAATTIDELGLSSLERVELMVALEDAFQARIDEGAFAGARSLADLQTVVDRATSPDAATPADPVDFPSWNRAWPAWFLRRISLPTWILPLARVFAWIKVDGREHLQAIKGPVMFASNHQSHMDAPVILAALPGRIRYGVTIAMAKEFFKAHFFPDQYGRKARFTNSLNYYLAALFFGAFPLPQREAGARQTLRYIGDVLEDDFSVLIFPEGRRSDTGEIGTFRPGIGMIASRLGVPVVPVRIEGLDKVLHHTWRMARPGRVRVAFGAPIRLTGDNYEDLARQVEAAVRAL